MLCSDVLLHSVILTNTLWARSQRPTLSSILRRFRVSADAFSPVSLREGLHVDEDCSDFLPWLENKAGAEIPSLLSIGKSAYGRALFASEDIQPGDCQLKVPYSLQLAPDNLPGGISCSLGDEVGDVAKVALLILHEKRLGEKSEWAPYVSRLPLRDDSVLWSDEELEMIRVSGLHEETLKQKEQIEKQFSAVKLVFDRFPGRAQTVTLEDFAYAYGLVTSRAWESSRGVSMIPFADFFNHNGASESYVLSDEGKQRSEVRMKLTVPQRDILYPQKLELLSRDDNEFGCSENSFAIREVRRGSRLGKGIPQSPRAFARIMACHSQKELDGVMSEAAENDGRLARKPFKNKNREVAAHQLLLSEVSHLIEAHHKHMKLLVPTPPLLCRKSAIRTRLALDLLTGEL